MNNYIYMDKAHLHQTEDYGRTYLPKLVPDTTFQNTTSDRTIPRRLSKSEECSKRTSIENVTRQRRSLSTSYISLPNIVSYRELVSQSNSTTSTAMHDIQSNSETADPLENGDETDDGVVQVSIDPYPDIGVESFLNSQTFQEIPPTPPRKRKRKQVKIRPISKQENETKKPKQKRTNVTSKRWSQSDRIHQRELARKHPVKKQFLYSEIMEEELQSHIPKRIPGGKLKPIYKRTNEVDIFVPNYPLNVKLERLNVTENEDIPLTGNASDINKFRKQELREMLEKRKKLQLQKLKKRKKRVRFVLPLGHVDSEESDSENQSNLSDRGRTSICSQGEVGESEHNVTEERTNEVVQGNLWTTVEPNSCIIESNDEPNDKEELTPEYGDSKQNDSMGLIPVDESPHTEDHKSSAMFKLPVINGIKIADEARNETVTVVDSYRFRISKTNDNSVKYTRIDS